MHIYNIRANYSFVDVLAERFLTEYKNRQEDLAKVLFLLPNRRACQNLTDAFVRIQGLQPTILPRMEPIGDVDEEEVILLANSQTMNNLPPAVMPLERKMILTKLILQRSAFGPQKISLVQAYSLAQNLCELLDKVKEENLDFAKLQNIVEEKFSVHWQQTLELLKIITEFWPRILQERGFCDALERRDALFDEKIKFWQQNNTEQHIVIAGSTAAFPKMKELVSAVCHLKNGEVYLYGTDKYLDDVSWQEIDENHPQFELKELLEYLNIKRADIPDIPDIAQTEREQAVSEIMRPAQTSSQWLNLQNKPLSTAAFQGMKLISCDDIRQEAKSIAMIIRKTLEEKDKVAALVTMDRGLSRRVISELERWNIIADDSAGQPLNLTPIGVYLRLLTAFMEEASQSNLIALLKHPFAAGGKNYGEFNRLVRKLEITWRQGEEISSQQDEFLQDILRRIQNLRDLYLQPYVKIKDIFMAHIDAAEKLADTDIKSGTKIIWKEDAGNAAAQFVSEFLQKCDILESIPTKDYAAFINALLSEKNVRRRYGMHPRVKILGPIEARLCLYDTIIIAEVNEGIWPKLPDADMWMSRPMKHDFGLPQAERAIGLMAADFAHLLHAKEVFITRAAKSADSSPTNKSRWWLRLETVLAANFAHNRSDYAFIYNQPYSQWAKNLERHLPAHQIKAPNPCPPVEHRPRKLSASNIEILMRDPYTIYAKYILHLYPLDELDKLMQSKDLGIIVHKVLQIFNDKYKHSWPDNAKDELIKLGRGLFEEYLVPEEKKAFWWPQYEKIIDWVIKKEAEYRLEVKTVHNEIKGEYAMPLPAGDFTVTATADRIDILKNNSVNIIDYKTGKARSIQEMLTGKAPQLPIEGLIAIKGGFENLSAYKVNSLQYWDFKEVSKSPQISDTDCAAAIANIENVLYELINEFDNPQRPYLTNPTLNKNVVYTDYEHLSRVDEWSVKDNSNADDLGDEDD